MTHSLTHRGPNSFGVFQNPAHAVSLGHRRLIIRDKIFGHQPMVKEDGALVAVFNGEIYNYWELRKELESNGCIFTEGHCDTEVLLHGYRVWKDRLPEKLNGMWAFAIYDKMRSEIFLSRDRFGQKPLFYTKQGNTFAFASELKALRAHPNLKFETNSLGVKKYFAHGYLPYDKTIFLQVFKLPAGCNLILNVKDLSQKIVRYWEYSLVPDESRTEEYWINEVREKLGQAVSRHLISDVPLGVFLSGGLDSSGVLALARDFLGPKAPISSFSIAFDEPSFDETTEALNVSHLFATNHHYETFNSSKLKPLMKNMFSGLDEPISDSSLMSYYLLCEFAAKKVTVAVGGDAADELFAGYDTFRAIKMTKLIEPLCPRPMHKGLLAAVSRLPVSNGYMPLHFKLQRTLKAFGHPISRWNPLWLGPLSPEEISEILHEPAELEEIYSEAIEFWDSSRATNDVDRTLEFYGKLFLTDQILVKVDRMSMAHSLEVRVPFLDVNLVDIITRMPNRFKLKGQKKAKYVLKKALEKCLPESVVWRKKVGFGAPLTKWFADGSIEFEFMNQPKTRFERFVHNKYLEHKNMGLDHRLVLWNAMVYNSVLNRN